MKRSAYVLFLITCLSVSALFGLSAFASTSLGSVISTPTPPHVMTTWGPDGFGYRARDINDSAQYQWESTSGANEIWNGSNADENWQTGVPIGFSFPFYDSSFTTCAVSANGLIAFSSDQPPTYGSLPDAYYQIAPWKYDNYHMANASHTYFQSLSAPTRFVMTFTDLRYADTTYRNDTNYTKTFQIVLYPSGLIRVNYLHIGSVAPADTNPYVAGIDDHGSNGINVFPSGTLTANLNNYAIEYYLSTVPAAPFIVSPANEAINVLTTTSLHWRTGSHTNNIDLYLSASQNSVTNLDTTVRVGAAITDSSFTLSTALNLSTQYYWRVIARNTTTGETNNSPVWSFTTVANNMNGIKTIGGTNPDYTTISAAISTLNSTGTVTGVTFLIRGGTYTEAPDTIKTSALSGPNAPVIFRPVDTLGVIINKTCTATAQAAFTIANASNIVFDGSNSSAPGRSFVTVNATTTSGLYAFRFTNGSSNCAIKFVTMTVGSAAAAAHPVHCLTTATPASGCERDSVVSCIIQGGGIGISVTSVTASPDSNWYIANNQIVNFIGSGITLGNFTSNMTVDANIIHRTTASTTALTGITLTGAASNNHRIIGNWIHHLTVTGAVAIAGINANGGGTGSLIANNMIDIEPTGAGAAVYGIYLPASRTKVTFNTVHLGGNSTTNVNSAALYIAATTTDTIANNIFVNERTGGAAANYNVAMWLVNVAPFAFSNNNIITVNNDSVGDNRYAARYVTTNYNLLSNLQQATGYNWDNVSLPFMPVFHPYPDLHIDSTVRTPIESNGIPIAGVSVDFDNQPRSATTPDIGADEGDFLGGGDFIHPTMRHTALGMADTTTPRVAIAYIRDNIGVATGTNQPRLYHKLSSASTWNFVNADSILQDSIFYFTLPGYPFQSTVQYYLAAQDTSGNVVTLPANGSGSNPPGTTPPSALFSYFVRQALTGVKTIGATNSDYTSLSAALVALNTFGVGAGGVTFSIRNGTYADSAYDISVNNDSTRPIMFQPDSGAAVVLNQTGNARHTAAVKFIRVRNVTIDGSWSGDSTGRHLTIAGLAAATDQTIWFSDSSANCTVKNCVLTLATQTSATYRAVQIGNPGVVPDVPITGCTVRNCLITGGYYGVYAVGNATELVDNSVVDKCEIRDFNSDGIYTGFGSNILISHNWLHRTTAGTVAALYGIYLNTSTTNSHIIKNHIGPLTSTAVGATYGIRTYGTGNLIANNMISIGANNTGATYGITEGLAGGANKIFFNSVLLTGTATGAASSAAFYNANATGTDSLWGNILNNTRSGGTSGTHTAITTNIVSTPFSNFNILSVGSDSAGDNRYIARLTNGVANTNFNTLDTLQISALWSPRDGSSFPELVPFDSTNDLHVMTTVRTYVESNAPHNPLVTDDFDGDSRTNTMADIGADEGNFLGGGDMIRPTIRHTPLTTTDSATARPLFAYMHDNVGLSTGTNQPRLYHKLASATNWNFLNADSIVQDSIYYFTIPGYPLGSTVWYYLAAQDTSGNVETLPAGGNGFNPPGTTPPTAPFSYFVRLPLAGVKTIGVTNSDYPSISAALAAINNFGVGTGGVTFSIRNGTYADSANDIIANFDSTRPILFRPDSGATVTLNQTGNVRHTSALRFIRARYVTIDGSWNGDSTGKHLTIAGTTINQVIWFGDSSANNTVKNCVLNLGNQTTTTYRTVQIGNGTVNVPITGNTLRNCDVVGGYWGVYLVGVTAATVDNNIVDNCNVHDFYFYGIATTYGSNNVISRNWVHRTTASGSATLYGIWMNTSSNNNRVIRNRVGPLLPTAAGATYGIRTYGTGNLIANNMISVGTNNSGATYGITAGLAGGVNKMFFNSVLVSGTAGAAANSAAYYNANTTGTDSLWGNILQNTRTGGGVAITHTAITAYPVSVPFSNYNLLSVGSDSVGDNRYLARLTNGLVSTNVNTFDSLRLNTNWSPRDGFSFSEVAPFDSTGDLHINPTISTAVENGAQRNSLVTDDFDGDVRANAMADIGADEGNFTRFAFGTIQGAVRDSSTAQTPIRNATIQAGAFNTTSDSTGHYTLNVRSGVYTVIANAANCYLTNTRTNITVDTATVTVNFWMLRPLMTANPTSIEIAGLPGAVISTTLDVQNPGSADLHWSGRAVGNPHGFDKWSGNINSGNGNSPIHFDIITKSSKRKTANPREDALPSNTNNARTFTIDEIDTTGGPDSFGYRFIDNNTVGGPTFGWITHTAAAHQMTSTDWTTGDDNSSPAITLPFTFTFYGTGYTSIYMNTNGNVTFATNAGIPGTTLPQTTMPAGIFFWPGDMITYPYTTVAANSRARYESFTNPQMFVITYDSLGNYSAGTNRVSCQIILYPNNDVIVQYRDITTGWAAETIGIQNTNGAIYLSYGTPVNNTAIKFTTAPLTPPWLTMNPLSGTAQPHQVSEISIQATIDSNATIPSTWTGTITITSDACPNSISIPVTVQITDAAPEAATLPHQYKLYQNYPNPFNPTTEIRFDLKLAGITRLLVFDVTGRQVTELTNRYLSPGFHTVRFDATHLANGAYFYRIESGKFTDVKKMILVK